MKKIFYLLAIVLSFHSLGLNGQSTCPNLVTNGNFETSNTITSGYPSNCTCFFGSYCINTSPNLKCSTFTSFTGHNGTGRFLIIQGGAAANIWSTTVTVTPNTPYTFSFWGRGITQTASLTFLVNNVSVAPFSVTSTAGAWTLFTFSGTTPAGVTSLPITIRQTVTSDLINYAIDDISFQSCVLPDPCYPSFTTTNLNSCGNVQFNNQSDGIVPLTYLWNFGDGGTSTLQNPTHQYTSCGTYNACMTLFTSDGCTGTFCRQIVVADNIPPEIACPVPRTVSCTSDTIPSISLSASASDNCGTPMLTRSDIVSGNFPCNGTVSRTWTARDACGNTSTCIQTIIVSDKTLPIITCPPTVTVSCSTDTIPSVTGRATATDNCGTPTLTYVTTQSGIFPCNGTLRRTWTARDACGNTSSCFQIVSVTDKVAPTITCPQNTTVSCSTVATPALTGTATATDNCGTAPTITPTDQALGILLPCSGFINRTWSATDACGNTSTCLQVITISDKIPPTIVCPPNATVTCATDTLPSVTGTATATDNCTNATLSRVDTISSTLPCDAVIRRTWKARDVCGNVSACIQTIFVRDNIAPTITCPQNTTVSCSTVATPALTGTATATDNCGAAPTITSSDQALGILLPCNGVINRTWSATDACRNTSTCLQVITVSDKIPPTIVCPPNVTVTCTTDTLPSVTGTATATDNCTNTTLSRVDTISGILPCDGVIRRTWKARDVCGNVSACVQTIFVRDNVAPKITCPQSYTVNTNAGQCYYIGTLTQPTATDNCDKTLDIVCSLLTTGSSILITPTTQFPKGMNNISCIARDECGNNSTVCNFNLTVVDTEKPKITCPLSISVAGSITPPSTVCKAIVNGLAPTVTDNCPMTTVGFNITPSANATPSSGVNDASGTSFSGTSTVTYTATDMVGNTASCSFNVAVTCSPCLASFNYTASELCNNIQFSNLSSGTPPITYSWNFGDPPSGANNTSTLPNPFHQFPSCGTFTVCLKITTGDGCRDSVCRQITIDNVVPTITCPANMTVACVKDTTPSVTGRPVVTDNCSTPVLTYVDVISGSLPCDASIARTWTATDACGNKTTCTQTILVRDNVPPIITNCPTNQTVNTNAGQCYYTFPTLPVITATDNCDPNPSVTYSYINSLGIHLPFTTSTQFPKGNNSIEITVKDRCNNVSQACIFTLTVVDTEKPKITCPLSISVAGSITPPSTICKAIVNGLAPTVTDNCSMTTVGFNITPAANATPSSGTNDASGGSFSGTSTVTYTATDMAGNTASCSFNVTVTCSPCLASFNYTTSGTCNNIQFSNLSSGTPPITYSWNFGDPPSAPNNTSTLPNPVHQFPSCGTFNVCLKITTGDGCRDSVCRQITIDNAVPTMTCPPNAKVACAKDTTPSVTGRPVVTDNCSTPVLTYVDVISGSMPCDASIARTWTATDACGNKTTCTQTILVRDNVPPVLTNCPTNLTVNTNAGQCYYTFPTLPAITTTDNCDPNPSVSYTYINPIGIGVTLPFTTSTQFPKGINFLTITVRDACNNVSTCSFTLTVVDNQPPKITCPLSITVSGARVDGICRANVTGLAPTVTDNCPMVNTTYTINSLSFGTNGSGSNDASGMSFTGTSAVTYTATDMAGNTATCSFTVTVNCGSSQPDFKGFNCGQAIITCFSGFSPGTNTPDPNGPVLAQIDVRQHGLANLGTNWNTSPPTMYHASDWKSSKMGQIFGVTIDANNNVYTAATTMYGDYLPPPLTKSAYGNVYKIDATTGNVSVIATLPQDLSNPAGLGDVWFDVPNNQLFVSNFYNGLIYRLSMTGAILSTYDYTGTTIGVPSPGFIARGERVWAVATDAKYLYFSVWNEDRARNSTAIKNQIRRIPLAAGGIPPTTGAGTLVHDMSDLITIDAAGVATTQPYSSPVSDIQFSQTGNMLVAERSMKEDIGDAYTGNSGNQSHVSRVIEISPAGVEKLYYVGNPYNTGAVARHHANSAGGIDYGYESFNPRVSPKPALCDSMIWTTGDALRFPGFNTIHDGSTLLGGGGISDYVYGVTGIRYSKNSNDPSSPNFVKNTSIYIDADNNLSFPEKTQIGDIDIFKCGCTAQPSLCDSINITSMPLTTGSDSCCFKLTVNNQKPGFFHRIKLTSSAGVSISSLSTLSGWTPVGIPSATMITLQPSGGFPNTIPVATQDIIKICLSNYLTVPNQEVIVQYLAFNGTQFEAVCYDTLRFNCTQKPKCMKVTTDTAICTANGQYQMSFCVMTDPLIGWDVHSFILNPPAGVTFTPNTFTLSTPITPGSMQCGFTTTVSGPNATDGKTICYTLTGKALNNQPPINCCTDTVVKACVTLPTCKCDKLSVSATSVLMPPDSCCWSVTLTNNYSNTYFSGVQLNILTGGVVFGAIDGGAWNVASSSTHATFTTLLPRTYLGMTSVLPTFCLAGITGMAQVPQRVEVVWLDSLTNAVCRDTLVFNCDTIVESDCAVIVNPNIKCSPNILGAYTFSFQVYNNSYFTVNKVEFNTIGLTPSGGFIAPTSFAVPPIAPTGTSSVLTTTIYGLPPNGQFCFTLTVHDTARNGNELNCCSHSQQYCFTVPPCDTCACGNFNILYAISRGPLLPKRCGDTLTVPTNGLVLPINLLTSFACQGDSCRDSVRINWTLMGPTGFTPLSNSASATPSFTIPINNATFTIAGVYTLTMSGICGTKQCTCKLYFRVESTCCGNRDQFVRNINNAVNITVNNILCKATVNINTLPSCDEITNIQWGDGTITTGPLVAGSMSMHTYTGSGTYVITTLVLERNPSTNLICFEYLKKDTIRLVCSNGCIPSCKTDSVNISTGIEPNLPPQAAGHVSQMWTVISAPTASGIVTPTPANFVTHSSWASTYPTSRWISAYQFNNSTNYVCPASTTPCSSCEPFVYERYFCTCDSGNVKFDFKFWSDNYGEVELWNNNAAIPTFIMTLASNCSTPNTTNNATTPQLVNLTKFLQVGKYSLRVKHWNTNGAPMGVNIQGTLTSPNLYKDSCCTERKGCLLIRKYNDKECNGRYDWDISNWVSTDSPLSGWVFTAVGVSGSPSATVTTNAQGEAYICNLPAGTYNITETPQPGWMPSTPVGGVFNSVNVNNYGVQIIEFGNCKKDTCVCGTFTEMTFRPAQGAQTAIVKCGDALTLGCNPTFNLIFGGNFQCVGNCSTTSIKWELRKGSSIIASGSLTSPSFTLSLLATYFVSAGQYELTFTGQCGTTVCPPCKFIINVLPAVSLTTGLTGYFPFNGNANDVSPTAINGIGSNLILGSALNGSLSAYTFNGSSSMIDATNNNRGITDKVSVCAWVRTTETSKGMWVAGQYLGGSNPKGYLLSIGDVNNSSSSIGLASFNGRVDASNYYAAISSPATAKVNDGRWHCLVGTAGVGTTGVSEWKIYVDGVLTGSVPGATSTIAPTNTSFTIGRHSDLSIGSMWYNGNMDDVRVYNKVLTQCEIDSLCSTRFASGVGDINDRMHVSIFPNPTPGIFTLELSASAKSNMTFRVTDLMGRIILEKPIEAGNTQQTVTASDLSEGLYFLQVVLDGKVVGIEKFVKQ